MSTDRAFIGAALALILPVSAMAEEPLSAIDWLSRTVQTPQQNPRATPPADEKPVATGAAPAEIITTTIGGPNPDAIGILPIETTGLPRNLWGTSASEDLARLIRAERIDTLPAIQALLYSILLAELDPPADSDGRGLVYLARIDRLLDLGALEPALSMLEGPALQAPEPFRRWFDVALLTGQEDRACEAMRETPEIAPTFPARVFCLARGGDWNAAALSLRTGEALGYVTPEMAELLARFLDPELFEGEPPLPIPSRPSPLVLRLMEAIGEPMSTTTLPVAFAQSDLRNNAGWKTRLEAGERLARTGAIDPNRLLGLYTERQAAASGGVWDRVEAIQRFDTAMSTGDPNAVALSLPEVWRQMERTELEVPFATIYGAALQDLSLSGAASALAFRIGLLSPDYESVARERDSLGGIEPFLIGTARGNLDGIAPPDPIAGAIKAAFLSSARLTESYASLVSENRVGEAILTAIGDITDGARGDLRDVTAGLYLLRHLGLEAIARRASLELMLLERRG
ncbi:hypothetical protein OEW28_15080 [Defluviimonas sp. WL0002]|uniref:Uncharacterized protein n=1 Tax=Albidovulum marisflavi TaxID=2984159 RepID=A0ABT2ZFR2_9RHOB|nr:hypothetical protein [Defluviimonas sp. WL0002]MCV2869952.1 hypothetical protein [Defluviimonas sp. WL0002]